MASFGNGILRLRELLHDCEVWLWRRVDGCTEEYRTASAQVLQHLILHARSSRPYKVGLTPFSQFRAPLCWVRFRLEDNRYLRQFAKARGLRVQARHFSIPRRSPKPSKAHDTHPPRYDWPWTWRDFVGRSTRAQHWEAALAAEFEVGVMAPMRLAIRASRLVRQYAARMTDATTIRLDLAAAEQFVRTGLDLPLPPSRDPPAFWSPWPLADSSPWENLDETAGIDDLLLAAGEVAASRLNACASEYTSAADCLRERLGPVLRSPLSGPRLAPGMFPNASIAPIVVWRSVDRPAGLPRAGGLPKGAWYDLPSTSVTWRSRYRSHVGRCNARSRRAYTWQEYFWYTEAPRIRRDFSIVEPWEQLLALYYDKHVLAPIRRQWLLAHWSRDLYVSCMTDLECLRLTVEPSDYMPQSVHKVLERLDEPVRPAGTPVLNVEALWI